MTKSEGGLCETSTNEGKAPYRSEALFAGRQEIEIMHGAARYVLRITKQGKLILNKKRRLGDE